MRDWFHSIVSHHADLAGIDIVNGHSHAPEELAKNAQSLHTGPQRGSRPDSGATLQRRAHRTREDSSGANFHRPRKLSVWQVSAELHCASNDARTHVRNSSYFSFSRPLSLEKKKIQETAKKPKLHFAPNHKVLAALEKTFYASFAVSPFFSLSFFFFFLWLLIDLVSVRWKLVR